MNILRTTKPPQWRYLRLSPSFSHVFHNHHCEIFSRNIALNSGGIKLSGEQRQSSQPWRKSKRSRRRGAEAIAVFSFENRELTPRLPMAIKTLHDSLCNPQGWSMCVAPCLQSPFHNYKQLRRPSQLINWCCWDSTAIISLAWFSGSKRAKYIVGNNLSLCFLNLLCLPSANTPQDTVLN